MTYVLDVSRVRVMCERRERKGDFWNFEPLFLLEAYLPLEAEYTCCLRVGASRFHSRFRIRRATVHLDRAVWFIHRFGCCRCCPLIAIAVLDGKKLCSADAAPGHYSLLNIFTSDVVQCPRIKCVYSRYPTLSKRSRTVQ